MRRLFVLLTMGFLVNTAAWAQQLTTKPIEVRVQGLENTVYGKPVPPPPQDGLVNRVDALEKQNVALEQRVISLESDLKTLMKAEGGSFTGRVSIGRMSIVWNREGSSSTEDPQGCTTVKLPFRFASAPVVLVQAAADVPVPVYAVQGDALTSRESFKWCYAGGRPAGQARRVAIDWVAIGLK